MEHGFEIGPVSGIDPALAKLIEEAVASGSAFMAKVLRHWQDGSNRFDGPGEVYLALWQNGRIIAAGGLNRDPFADDPACGRIRHVYVLQSARRTGAGRALLAAIAERARGHFARLRLRTTTAQGASFYEAIGYSRCDEPAATHMLTLQAAA